MTFGPLLGLPTFSGPERAKFFFVAWTGKKAGGLALTYGNTYADGMTSMNASEAREKLYRLLDETASDHEPVLITGPRSNAVLVGEEDWNSIQETLYLLSVPGMRESIAEGLATPTDRCEKEPGW